MTTIQFIARIALCLCALNVQAAGIADALHLADDYPSCSFRVIDKNSQKPVEYAFVSLKWFKNYGLSEHCRNRYTSRAEHGIFVTPEVQCTGPMYDSTMDIVVKAPGYRWERYRIFRRLPPTIRRRSDYGYFTELSIRNCSGAGQVLPLTKFRSIKEALDDYARDPTGYYLGSFQITPHKSSYYKMIETEFRALASEMSAIDVRKSYCTIFVAHDCRGHTGSFEECAKKEIEKDQGYFDRCVHQFD